MNVQLPGVTDLIATGEIPAAPSTAGRVVFYSTAAQEDNLGDVVIRRNVLHWITRSGADLHIYRGGMSDSYITALKVPGTSTVHQSSRSFADAWLRSSGRRQAAVVFAPGPRTAMPGMVSLRSASIMALMTGLTRASGGPVIAVGGAIRGKPSPAMLLHQLTASMCSDYSVRDEVSRGLLRDRPRPIPDVAFADATPTEAVPADPVLVLSFRSDREIDFAAVRRLVTSAASAGIKPVIVTQVRRDQPNHQRLAGGLGIELCGWVDQSHSKQLDRIDHIYRRAVVIYSNRLHACIFGARNAAAVIAPETGGNGKVQQTLRSVYPCLTEPPRDLEPLLNLDSVQNQANRSDLADHARLAAHALVKEQATFGARLTGPAAIVEGNSAES